MSINDEAFTAAQATYTEVLTDLRLKEGGGFKVGSQTRRALRAALEAAVPHLTIFPGGRTQSEWKAYLDSYR